LRKSQVKIGINTSPGTRVSPYDNYY